ncbi:MAG: hypothetical protein DRN06_09180 [Thermoprotei archaeon]|nr:MAG: hypothetical protein DRN06_09180 [Thermoprotei archaeon]
MTLVVKKVDERKLREFKAEAIRRGLTLSQALEEAIELWLRASYMLSEEDANNMAYIEAKRLLRGHEGEYAVFAHGRLLGFYRTLSEVSEALKSLDVRPRHAIVVKVGVDSPPPGELEWLGGSIELETA